MNKASCTVSTCVGTALAAMLLVAAGAAAQSTVTFRSWGTDADAALKALAADFEKENPDIKIVIQTTSASPDGLIAAVAGGVAPDASMVNGNYWVGLWQAIQPLDDLFKAYAPELRRSNFLSVSWDRTTFFGRQMGLPLRANSRILMYDKDAFSAAGIAGPPQTWAEVADDAHRLTRQSAGKVSRWGLGLTSGVDDSVGIFAKRNGWRPFTPDFSQEYFTDQRLLDTLAFLNGMVKDGVADSEYGSVRLSQFPNGGVAMTVAGPWSLPSWRKSNASQNIGYFAPPVGPSNEPTYQASAGGEDVVMLKSAKDKAATLKWLEYLTYTRNEDYVRLAGAYFPVVRSAVSHPMWNTELWRAVEQDYIGDRFTGIPGAIADTHLSDDAYASALQAIFTQKEAIEPAMTAVAQVADAELAGVRAQLDEMKGQLTQGE